MQERVYWTGGRSAMQQARARVAHQTRLLNEETSASRECPLVGRAMAGPTELVPTANSPPRQEYGGPIKDNVEFENISGLLSSAQMHPTCYDYAGYNYKTAHSGTRFEYAGYTRDGWVVEENPPRQVIEATQTKAPAEATNFRQAFDDHVAAMDAFKAGENPLSPSGALMSPEPQPEPEPAPATEEETTEPATDKDELPVGYEQLRVDLVGFLEDVVLHPRNSQPALLGGMPGAAYETRPAMARRPRPEKPPLTPPVHHRSIHSDSTESNISNARHQWIKIKKPPSPPPAEIEPEPEEVEDKCVVVLGMGGSSFVQSLEYFTKSRKARVTTDSGKTFMFNNVDSEFIDSYKIQMGLGTEEGARTMPDIYTTGLEWDRTIGEQHI